MGTGVWWAWIRLCYSNVGLSLLLQGTDRAAYVAAMYVYSTPAIAVAIVLGAVLWRKVAPLLENQKLVMGVSLLAVTGTLLIAYSILPGGNTTFAMGAVLTGLGTSVLCLKTGMVYGTSPMRESLTAGSVSLIFASFLFFMGVGVPSAWQPIFIAVLPLFSALLYIMPTNEEFPAAPLTLPSAAHGKILGMRSFVHAVAAAAIVAITAGLGAGAASACAAAQSFAASGVNITFLIFLISCVIVLMVNCGDIVRAIRRVYALLILMGVGVILASAFGFGLICLSVGKELLWMMFTCIMAYLVLRFDIPAVRAFGYGQAVYFVASTISWGAGYYFANALSDKTAQLVLGIAMAFAIVFVYTFVFTESDIKFICTWLGRQVFPSATRASVCWDRNR